MPISQKPTINIIDQAKGQFAITFGVQFDDNNPENIQTVAVPNLIGLSGELFSVDLLSANTPAKGNIPAIRSIGFSLNLFLETPSATTDTLYMWNPQTNQVYSFLVPLTPSTVAAYPGNINGVIPFFCKANQSISLFKPLGTGCFLSCSFTAFTFDADSFYAINQPFPFTNN